MSGPLTRRRTLGGLAAGALAAGTLPRTASAADTDDLRQRHALAGQSRSASGLRRAHAGPDAERLRQSLSLPGRSAEDRALAGGEPHRVARRPRSGNSSSGPTSSSTTAARSPPRMWSIQLPPRAGTGAGAVQRLPQDPEARRHHRGRSAHRALQARDVLRAVLRGDPLDQHRQSAGHQGQREGRRLGQDVARLQRRGLGRLQDHPGRLPSAGISRHGDQPGSLPGLGRQPQAGEEDRLPPDQGDVDAHPGAAQRHASTAPTPTCRPTRWRRSTSPRSPMCRRTWSCGPSSSA